jgi:hypothetical protein
MMRPTKIALLSLVLVPAVALAQRGGAGGSSKVRGDPKADWNSVENANKGVKLSNRDLENISPIKLLIDKKKDLKLSDDQVNKLKELDGKLKETNDPSFKVLDSLRRAAQPPLRSGEPSDEERDRMMSARRGIGAVVGTIRGNYESSAKDAMAILDETQQKTAAELLTKQKEEAEDMLRDKLGGGRG